MSVDIVEDRTSACLEAVTALGAGEVVVLTDGAGDALLVLAAEHAATSSVAFMIRHTSGFLVAAMPPSECERLDLPPMWWRSHKLGPSQCVSVDHRGPGTGISARDRARTLATLADPTAVPADLIRPGHVVPVSVSVPAPDSPEPARLEWAALALLHAAGLRPVAVLGGLVDALEPALMSDRLAAIAFATRHGMIATSVSAVVALNGTGSTVRRAAGATGITSTLGGVSMPTPSNGTRQDDRCNHKIDSAPT